MRNKAKSILRVPFFLVALNASIATAIDWPQALGSHRNGVVSDERIVPPTADQRPKVAWHANVGHGSSPVAVVGGKVYVYGVFKPGTKPDQLSKPTSTPTFVEVMAIASVKEPALRSGDVPGTPPPRVRLQEEHGIFRGDGYAQCLDAATGKRIWATKVTDWGIIPWGNTLATERSSPAIAQGRLFIHTINGHLHCLNASSGQPEWDVNLFNHGMLRWEEKNGNASSPLVVGDTVIVSFTACRSDDVSKFWLTCNAVAGFDVASGKPRWMTKLPMDSLRSMSSDIGFARIGSEDTVLVPGGMGTAGINPANGTFRWKVEPKWLDGFRIWAQYPGRIPVAAGNIVVDCTTIGHDDKPSQAWGIKVVPGGASVCWATHDFVPASAEMDKSNVLVIDGKVYGFDAHGVWDDPMFDKYPKYFDRAVFRPRRTHGRFQCRDLATGKLLWSTDALNIAPAGQDEYYSPTHIILVGDVLVVVERHGLQFARLKGDGLVLLSRFGQRASTATFLESPPVVSGGRLFERQSDADLTNGLLRLFPGDGNLICFDLRPQLRKQGTSNRVTP